MNCAERIRLQCGAATLAVTLTLLFSLSLMMLYAARATVAEQRLAANDARARTAFAAAQAGLDRLLAGLAELDRGAIAYDAAGRATVDARSGTLSNGAAYTAEAHNRGLTPFSSDLLRLEAHGAAGDGDARRATLLAAFDPLLPNPPPAPLLVRGDLMPAGDLVLGNLSRPVAAWVGGSHVPGGALNTQLSAPASCLPDGICAGDARIGTLTPEAFFANFFGREPRALRAAVHAIECSPCDPAAVAAAGETIWLENGGGAVTLGAGELGTEVQPVVAVIAGDLELSGTLQVHGLLVVLGDWRANGAGLGVEGALVVTGDAAAAGPAELHYHAGILETLRLRGRYSAVPGSWSDL